MNLFPQRDPKQPIPEVEKNILQYWKDNNVFEKTVESRSKGNIYRFFDGPPFATGTPHYGHILAGAIKDMVPRYWTMKGYRVERRFGWDCHGVPVEFQVEKEHDIGGKEGIEKMGIGKFNETCRSIVLRCRDEWEETVDRMGRFVDFKNDYKTMDPEFMESVWWVFGELWKKDLIYQGDKVIAYSPKLGSPLSNFEANLNYKDIDDPAVTVKFELVNNPGTYLLAWTTTPWTLPSNLGLCIREDMEYAKVEYEGVKYVVAKSAIERLFGEEGVLLDTFKGSQLKRLHYKPLFPFFKETENAFQIFADDYVSDDSGTGIVHLAPTGEDDARILQHEGVPLVYPFTDNCYFDETIPELKGKYFRDDETVEGSKEDNVNQWVLENLGDKLFKREQIRHSYPHCWRTDCALMYRGIDTWFVAVQKIKERMLELNEDINWLPEHLKHGRFGKILEGAPDWAISRNRYWGCPIPVWQCDKTGEVQVVTSQAELAYLTGKEVTDLHKHNIDKLTWKNEVTEGTMRRIPEVLDCWFESGSMPYGSNHYPYKKKEVQSKEAPTVYVVRHGQSENNILEIESCKFETQTQFGLVYPGKQQCIASAKELKEQGVVFDVILTSPFRRTVETADIFSAFCGGEVHIEERLKETDLGHELDLAPYQEATKVIHHPDREATMPFPGGESLQDVEKRLRSLWEEIQEKYKGKRILLVSHGGPIANLKQVVEGKDVAFGALEDLHKNGKVFCLTPDNEGQNIVFDPEKTAIEAFQSADFIAEGLDQTRGWFYTLHVLGTALFDKPIYKNVITNGIVLAEDGQKMSKSKKNYPDPMNVFDTLGADATRFYMLSSQVVRGENFRFAEKGVQEILKSLLLPLRSSYQFFSTYANIDNWKPTKIILARHGEAQHNVEWIYSGKHDNPHSLTKEGEGHVQETAQNLPDFDVLVHSPFVRTKETADIIIKETGFKGKVLVDERVKEADFGTLEGKKLIGRKTRLVGDVYKGEKLEDMRDRVEDFVQEVQEKYAGKTVVVVTHGDVFSLMHMVLNDIPASEKELFAHMPMPLPGGAVSFFPLPDSQNELDKWILSEMQTVCKSIRAYFDEYDLELGLREIPPFVDKLNNWYLRRSRKRFWASGLSDDKQNGYATLHYVLWTLSKLLAPVCPFFAEQLYLDLGGVDSVHLEYFPHPLKRFEDLELSEKVALEREIATLSAGIRAEKKIKLRQPLQKIRFSTTSKAKPDRALICEEANVKEVEVLESLEGIAQPIIRVNARQVGKKFGPKVQELIKAGKAGDFKELEDGAVEIAGERLEQDEYERGYLCEEGIEAASTVRSVVLLDTEVTEELEIEGMAREVIRAIQEMRKKNGFDIADRIKIQFATDSQKLQKVFEVHDEMISNDVLATEIQEASVDGDTLDVDGERVVIVIKK